MSSFLHLHEFLLSDLSQGSLVFQTYFSFSYGVGESALSLLLFGYTIDSYNWTSGIYCPF